MGQAVVYTEERWLTEELSYTLKVWSWSPKEIPARIFHKHFLEIQFLLFLFPKGSCGCSGPAEGHREGKKNIVEELPCISVTASGCCQRTQWAEWEETASLG